MRFAAELADGLDHLGHPAAVGGMVVAQSAAVGVERQRADARDQIAVGDECAATAALAETEMLQRDQQGDRETVVDRGKVGSASWRERVGQYVELWGVAGY